MSRGVVLFHTTSAALRAEKILQKAGLAVKLISTPLELSSDCGIALKFDLADHREIEQRLTGAGAEIEIYTLP